MTRRTARVVYVTQYGAWWSATPEAWKALCERAVKSDGDYNLDKTSGFRPLTGRPRAVLLASERGSDRPMYWSPTHTFKRPLDWTVADFEDELRDLRSEEVCDG